MPTRLQKLEEDVELLRLKLSELEFRLEHMTEQKPQTQRARRRDFDTWNSVNTLYRAGMSRANICKMFHMSYRLCNTYLSMSESDARALPSKKAVNRIIFKAKLEHKE